MSQPNTHKTQNQQLATKFETFNRIKRQEGKYTLSGHPYYNLFATIPKTDNTTSMGDNENKATTYVLAVLDAISRDQGSFFTDDTYKARKALTEFCKTLGAGDNLSTFQQATINFSKANNEAAKGMSRTLKKKEAWHILTALVMAACVFSFVAATSLFLTPLAALILVAAVMSIATTYDLIEIERSANNKRRDIAELLTSAGDDDSNSRQIDEETSSITNILATQNSGDSASSTSSLTNYRDRTFNSNPGQNDEQENERSPSFSSTGS